MRHQLTNPRRGSAMLEAALIYGTFLFMLIAVFDIGQYMFIHDTLVERARAAVRYGVSRPFNEGATTKNMFLYSSPTQPEGATPLFGLDPANVSVSLDTIGPGSPSLLRMRISGWRYLSLTPTQAGQKTGADILVSLPSELP